MGNDWTNVLKFLLAATIVLSPAILYVIALVVTAIRSKYYPDKCPQCGERGLDLVNFILATVVIDGRRAPDSWSYYVCRKCDAWLKHHRKEWGPVPEHEKHHVVTRLEHKKKRRAIRRSAY